MVNFIKERNEVLLSVDEDKLNAYAKKYEITFPESKYVFWLSIKKALEGIKDISDSEKAAALKKIEKKMEEYK